jgi:hypothetical protein
LDELHVLRIDAEDFKRKPQVGVPCCPPWSSFASGLREPRVADDKGIKGGFALGLYQENTRRKDHLIHIGAVSFDFDQSGVEPVAARLKRYACVVHETFSSTPEAPRCRAFIRLAERIDAATYERLHGILREKLRSTGLPPDESAKDASRLSYSPVRRPGASYAFRVLQGKPLNAAEVIRANPPPPPRSAPRVLLPEHRDGYAKGALRRAAEAIANAGEGERHHALCREAASLARAKLNLSDAEIEAALLPVFIAVAGEKRAAEGIRTIRGQIRFGRGSAA